MRDRKYWQRAMEAEGEIDRSPDEVQEERVSKHESDDTQIIEELVYPYTLTLQLLDQYSDPLFKRDELGETYPQVMIKILRSCQYWRIAIPKWLGQRLGRR